MKILIDARLLGLENTGLGRYALHLITELSKIDHKNEYVILVRKKYADLLELPDNWRKISVEIPHYSIREQFELPKIIKKERPDLVHFLHFNVPVFYRGPYIVTIHDLLMHKNKNREATTLGFVAFTTKRFGYKYVFGKAITRAKRIIVPSKAVADDILRNYNIQSNTIEVIYEGVDKIFAKAKTNRVVLKKYDLIGKEYILYTGNAYPHKNLKRLVEAVALINETRKVPLHLVLVTARNVFRDRLEDIIGHFHTKKLVKIIEFVSDADLAVLYQSAKAFVFPSLHEGFGLPGVEAMMAKIPLVASDIPVFKEVYKDNAIYCNPYDFSSIKRAIEHAVEMDNKRKENLVDKAFDFSQKYSWEQMAKQTVELYMSEANS